MRYTVHNLVRYFFQTIHCTHIFYYNIRQFWAYKGRFCSISLLDESQTWGYRGRRLGRKSRVGCLTFILLTWRIRWAPNNANKWQMGFNSAFKGLINTWICSKDLRVLWRQARELISNPNLTARITLLSLNRMQSSEITGFAGRETLRR